MKTRTMNELRQEKNYGYKAPLTHNQKAAEARAEEYWPVKPKGYSEIDIDTTKELIINKLGKQYYDIIFQAVCDEMNKHEVFKEETYFTPQGIDWFEDQWFEFFHEHHGDIIHAVINNGITWNK